jgi:RNA polymerase sigma factor (sigma-70 family)
MTPLTSDLAPEMVRPGFAGEAAQSSAPSTGVDPTSISAADEAALVCGQSADALSPIAAPVAQDISVGVDAEESARVETQSDSELVAAIRGDSPDEEALDELARRHWQSLFARCQLMTLNREQAADVAQEAWCRLLRSRGNLRPDGNFAAYLGTIALNIWRDRCRAETRAEGMAERRMASLEASVIDINGDAVSLSDAIPDLHALEAEQQARLMLDIDEALERLSPVLRSVLVARFLVGESCAEIGRRHGRTEQTISGWIRQGALEMKLYLQESRCTTPARNTS